MAHLTIKTLGTLQILLDNVPVESFESDKVRALLAYLAVEADRPHPREALIELLWPDSPEETARHNLSQALFNLRIALGDHTAKPPFLSITREAIQFNLQSHYSLDLAAFNHYFDLWEKTKNEGSGVFPVLTSQLEEMAELCRGEFLQYFLLADSTEFENWIMLHREIARQHMIDIFTWLANEYELQGDLQTARRFAGRQLDLDPWREQAHCQIMRVLALDGQRTAALAQYEICRKILAEELGVEPSPPTRELFEQIRLGKVTNEEKAPSRLAPFPAYSLPIPITPFFGRQQELEELARLLADPDCRCISLVGPGGIGKTRLALQAAMSQVNQFAQGAAFVPLASVGDVEAVIPAMAHALAFDFYGSSDPRAQLLNYLREKELLLVIDNVEHLLVEETQSGTILDLLIEILQAASAVKLVITSREPLDLQGEWLFDVKGLVSPELGQTDSLEQYSAFALFIQRARRVHPEFVLNPEDKKGIIRICLLTEGMPLAIELAATWIRVLSPTEIAAEIDQSINFLKSPLRDLPERHRSMTAVFDHSWQMLPAEEQLVFRRLSVFQGGFSRKAAEHVAGASLLNLSSLVIRSLLRRAANGRYYLHELLRQYTAAKLAADTSELNLTQERHSLYYLRMLEEKGRKLQSAHQKEAIAELAGEIDNIRTAWYWAAEQQLLEPLYRVSFAIMLLFALRNSLKEAETLFQRTVEILRACDPEAERAEIHQVALNAILAHYGYFRLRLGAAGEAYSILAPVAAFLPTSADPSAALYALWFFGVNCWVLGKYAEAKENLKKCVKLAQEYGERWFESSASLYLGVLTHDQGEYSQASQYLTTALSIMRELGDPSMTGLALRNAGRTAQALDRLDEAEELLRASLELSREMDHGLGIGQALDSLGQLTSAQGRYEEAHAFFFEAANQFREMGDRMSLSRVLSHQGFNALARQKWADARITFRDALKTAQEGGIVPVTLNALIGLAALQIQQKISQETLALILFILQHPSSNQETKELAKRLLQEAEARLTQEEIEAAQKDAKLNDLDKFTREAFDTFSL